MSLCGTCDCTELSTYMSPSTADALAKTEFNNPLLEVANFEAYLICVFQPDVTNKRVAHVLAGFLRWHITAQRLSRRCIHGRPNIVSIYRSNQVHFQEIILALWIGPSSRKHVAPTSVHAPAPLIIKNLFQEVEWGKSALMIGRAVRSLVKQLFWQAGLHHSQSGA